MADRVIETSGSRNSTLSSRRAGPFWTSPTVGYVIYLFDGEDLKYRKTADGGATWGDAINIHLGSLYTFDCWADWQTDGDAGTKIHIAFCEYDSDDFRYIYLDTDGDSVGGAAQIEVCQGTGAIYSSSYPLYIDLSITKTRGGNLAVAFTYLDGGTTVFGSFYTSPDGVTWTSKASPWEGVNGDYLKLFPANLTDNQDLWATYWDKTADEISLKTYDDSDNSWSNQSISGSMEISDAFIQMDGQIRLSDGHLIFAAWSQNDNADADLRIWDITDAGTITAKTNVITNESESFLTSVFIDQASDDIYVAYVSGTTARSLVKVFYQLSQDGGGTWDGEAAMQADIEDDEKWVSCGAVKAAWGGKFQPFWFNDDTRDFFTNTDNGILIAAAVGGVDYPINLSVGLTASTTVLKGWGRGVSTTAGLTASATLVKSTKFIRSSISNITVVSSLARKIEYHWNNIRKSLRWDE